MDREALEAMTAEERLAYVETLEKELRIASEYLGGDAQLRISVGGTFIAFLDWFMEHLPLHDDSEERLRIFAEKHGWDADRADAELKRLKLIYAQPYGKLAMKHFTENLPEALADAIEIQFHIALGESVDQLQGKTFEADGEELKFPRANRAKLRRDIEGLLRRYYLKHFPGRVGGPREAEGKESWTPEEEQAFRVIVAEAWPLAKDVKDFRTEGDLRHDPKFQESPSEVQEVALRLLKIRKAARPSDRTPMRVACRFAAEQIGRTAYKPSYLEKMFQHLNRRAGQAFET